MKEWLSSFNYFLYILRKTLNDYQNNTIIVFSFSHDKG